MLCDLNQSRNIQSHISCAWTYSKWSQHGLTHCPRRSSGRPHGSVWWASCRSRCRPSADRSAAGESPRSPTCRGAPEPPPPSPVGCVYSSCPTIRGSASTRHTQKVGGRRKVVNVAGRCRFTGPVQCAARRSPCASSAALPCQLLVVLWTNTHMQGRPRLFGGPGWWFPIKGSPNDQGEPNKIKKKKKCYVIQGKFICSAQFRQNATQSALQGHILH